MFLFSFHEIAELRGRGRGITSASIAPNNCNALKKRRKKIPKNKENSAEWKQNRHKSKRKNFYESVKKLRVDDGPGNKWNNERRVFVCVCAHLYAFASKYNNNWSLIASTKNVVPAGCVCSERRAVSSEKIKAQNKTYHTRFAISLSPTNSTKNALPCVVFPVWAHVRAEVVRQMRRREFATARPRHRNSIELFEHHFRFLSHFGVFWFFVWRFFYGLGSLV